MPICEYRCADCGHVFDVLIRNELQKDRLLREHVCPECGCLAQRFYGRNSISVTGAIDKSFAEDNESYREMHFHEKNKDWESAARAAEGVSEFAKNKFLEKASSSET